MKSIAMMVAAGAAVVTTIAAEIPRPEYPRPQFVRDAWVNLNGDAWTYAFDFGESGREGGRELFRSKGFKDKIVVPFCPESKFDVRKFREIFTLPTPH